MPSYDVLFGPLAKASIGELPEHAVRALQQQLIALAEDPSTMQAAEGKPHSQSAVFGPGEQGMIFATVKDDHKVIIVDLVIWAG